MPVAAADVRAKHAAKLNRQRATDRHAMDLHPVYVGFKFLYLRVNDSVDL